MISSRRLAVYEASSHDGSALVRPAAAIAPKRLLLVGERAAAMLAPPLAAIAVDHRAVLTVYARPGWDGVLAGLVRQHQPDVVIVVGAVRPTLAAKHVWLALTGATSPLEFAGWAARAWRAACVRHAQK